MSKRKWRSYFDVRAGYVFYYGERKRPSGYASEREKVIYSVTTLQVYKATGKRRLFFFISVQRFKKNIPLSKTIPFSRAAKMEESRYVYACCWISLAMIDQLRCLKKNGLHVECHL